MATAASAINMYGPAFLVALLREDAAAETIADLRAIMAREGATFTVEHVAAERHLTIPLLPVVESIRRARHAPAKSRRAA